MKAGEIVFGKRSEFPMEHRIINAFFAFSLLAGIVFIPIMLVRGMRATNIAVLGAVALVGAFAYYRSRIRRLYKNLILPMMVVLWAYLIYGWFFAAGIFGTPHYFFILPLLLSLIFYRGLKRNTCIGITLVILIGLYFAQFARPDWIRAYQSAALQQSMKMAGHFINLSMLAFIVHAVMSTVDTERGKSEDLLRNILPPRIAEELKNAEDVDDVEPRHFDSVTVMFADLVGFTGIAEKLPPRRLVHGLHSYFSRYDAITTELGVEKLKTIGDSYMCAGGIPTPNRSHALDVCLAALGILRLFRNKQGHGGDDSGEILFPGIRIGIHTGPVTAGVVGKTKFAYDVWGDTVNTASRMESSGSENSINVSATTYELAREFFVFEPRGEIAAKGKGNLNMFYLLRLKEEYSADAAGIVPNAAFPGRRGVHAPGNQPEPTG